MVKAKKTKPLRFRPAWTRKLEAEIKRWQRDVKEGQKRRTYPDLEELYNAAVFEELEGDEAAIERTKRTFQMINHWALGRRDLGVSELLRLCSIIGADPSALLAGTVEDIAPQQVTLSQQTMNQLTSEFAKLVAKERGK